MKKTACFLFIAAIAVFAGNSTFSAQDDAENPIFISAVELIQSPTPCENSTAATAEEMKAYEDTIPAPAPHGDRKFKMLPISGGKFKMGSPASEKGHDEKEAPQFEVEVKPFWMGEAEVTWREFELYGLKYMRIAHEKESVSDKRLNTADALAAPTNPYNIGSISFNKSSSPENLPASGMTYYAGQMYCKWLTSVTGRYYRLPTEAEWEFACRAGTTTAFSFGDDPGSIDEYAWTAKNCDTGTGYHPIKLKKPNAFGLYDMHGNVAEWTCQQYKKGDYQDFADGKIKEGFVPAAQKAKFGIPARERAFGEVARGGSCDHDPADCRSATRLVSDREWKKQDPQFPQSIWWVTDAPYVGFRVVRPLTPPTADEAKLYDPDPEVWTKYRELNQRN